MLRFSPFSAFLCATICLTALSGCGQKGPLYLPQQGKPAASATIHTTSPIVVTPATAEPLTVEPSAPAASPDSK